MAKQLSDAHLLLQRRVRFPIVRLYAKARHRLCACFRLTQGSSLARVQSCLSPASHFVIFDPSLGTAGRVLSKGDMVERRTYLKEALAAK